MDYEFKNENHNLVVEIVNFENKDHINNFLITLENQVSNVLIFKTPKDIEIKDNIAVVTYFLNASIGLDDLINLLYIQMRVQNMLTKNMFNAYKK